MKARHYDDLNELHFVERDEFMQMAPAIVQLEVTRLTEMMGRLDGGSKAHTSVVASRHQLRLFLDELSSAVAERNEVSVDRIDAAILCLTMPESDLDPETYASFVYVADRLGYIRGQMKRLR